MIIIAWLILSVLVACFGESRKIGFGGALATSILFSPLIGFIVAALSKSKEAESEDQLKAKHMEDLQKALEEFKKKGL